MEIKKYTIVGFNENGRKKFPEAKERLFIFIAEIPNNPKFVIVRGFRGRYAFGDEFIECIDDLEILTESEVDEYFLPPYLEGK